MMTRAQREIAFIVFLLILAVSVVIQIRLINDIADNKVDINKSLIPLVSSASCILASVGIFFTMIKKEFLDKREFGSKELKNYFIDRTKSLRRQDCLSCTGDLIYSSLAFTEGMLRKEFGDDLKFEISVFSNTEQPEIIYYYDSIGNKNASSEIKRKDNPNYYIDKGYEVVKFMQSPTSTVEIIPNTFNDEYRHVDEAQKERIRSQAMLNISSNITYVLVVICNKKGVFKKNDSKSTQIIEAIGNCIKADIELKRIISKCEKHNDKNKNALQHAL